MVRKGPNLTIPNGDNKSNVIDLKQSDNIRAMYIYGSAALDGTATVYVYNIDADKTDITKRRKLKTGGSDFTVAAGDAEPLTTVGYDGLQIGTSVNQTAERVFETAYVI